MRNKSLLTIIAVLIIAMSSKSQVTGTFTDTRDGKVYKTIAIGTQIWMAENFAFKADSGCWAYDNDKANVATYGYLYTLETAVKACPKGWHLPTNEEWLTLISYLGVVVAGDKLKETGTTHWTSDNTQSTNKSGFTALPGGSCDTNGKGSFIGYFGYWWSSTIFFNKAFLSWGMSYNESDLFKDQTNMLTGLSVRYIKD